jgi:hypothetical protein
VDELALKKVVDFVYDQMVDDAITEVGGKDLTLDRLVDDKRQGTPGPVGAVVDLPAQRDKVLLVVDLKIGGVGGALFSLELTFCGVPSLELGLATGSIGFVSLYLLQQRQNLILPCFRINARFGCLIEALGVVTVAHDRFFLLGESKATTQQPDQDVRFALFEALFAPLGQALLDPLGQALLDPLGQALLESRHHPFFS